MDGNQFSIPLISLFYCCYVVLQMCILKKTSHLKSSYTQYEFNMVQAGLLLLEQFCNFISLLFYMSIVTDPNISAYWSKSSLYCGLWGKYFMSPSQYEQMNCF